MKRTYKKRKEKHFSNNLVALLAVAFAIISLICNMEVYKGTAKLMPVGRAVAQGTVSFNIAGYQPVPFVTYPNGCEVVNGTIMINSTVTDKDGNDSIANVSFYYSGAFNESGQTYVGIQVYDGDVYYEQSWNTSNVSDGIYYKIRINSVDNKSITAQDKSNNFFAVNNIDEVPEWEEFKYGVSTNLSTLSKWWNVSNLLLGNNYGMINFSSQTLNVDGVNLSAYIEITFAKIFLDDDYLPCMSVPAYLHFFNVSLTDPRILRDGVECSAPACILISNNGNDVVYRVLTFSTYEVFDNAQLEIWDVTDKGVYNGNQTRYKNEQTEFYANLTSNGTAVNDNYTSCWIRFNISADETEWEEMEFKGSSYLYESHRKFNNPGIYPWKVVCNNTQSVYFNYTRNDTVNISNRAPVLTSALPNITMLEDRQLLYVDLDDYFEDPDGDTMTYNSSYVPNIVITIGIGNIVTVAPAQNWYGNRSFFINAIDAFNATTQSNRIYITVIDVPEPLPETGAGGGGGGGGGYTETEYIERPDCVDKWRCSSWSACEFRWPDIEVDEINENDGIRTRSCVDVNKCNYFWKKPNETMDCFYQPTCDDHIKNQKEEKVDCGGPNCPVCPTCEDGVQNQNETGMDCGGPCKSCPSCYDGIQNQGEEGVDCGGPCKSCALLEKPEPIFDWLMIGLFVLMLSVLLFTTYIFVRPYIVRITLSIMGLKERIRRKEVPTKSLLDLELDTLFKLDKLIKMLEKGDLDDISKQFNAVFRRFLKEALKIEYEFTYEELQEEIKKQNLPRLLKIALSNYVKELTEIQYGKRKLTKELLSMEIKRAKELVDLIVKNLPKEVVAVEKKAKVRESRVDIISVYKLIVDAERALAKKDIEKAGKVYSEIASVYKRLPDKQKREIYQKVSKLVKDIDGMSKDMKR